MGVGSIVAVIFFLLNQVHNTPNATFMGVKGKPVDA